MTFIYADPPYLNTVDTYSDSLTWTEKDCTDLLDCLTETKCKFAMSEFDNEFVLSEAKKRNLNIIVIGERHNLKNKRTEILITNYEKQKGLFD
jgi:DNA adenine methylase